MTLRLKIITLLVVQAFIVMDVVVCRELIDIPSKNHAYLKDVGNHQKDTLSPQVTIDLQLFQQAYYSYIQDTTNKIPKQNLFYDRSRFMPFLNLIEADRLYDIEEDEEKNLFLKTNKGIYCLRVTHELIDGVTVERIKDSAGNLWKNREDFTKIELIKTQYDIPLPEPFLIKSIPFDSFTITEIVTQAEKVIDMIISDNDYDRTTINALLKLKQKIIGGERIEPLPHNTKGNDAKFWNQDINNISGGFIGKNWNDPIPQMESISYLYRLILEIVDYWDTGNDPFAKTKDKELETTLNNMPAILTKLEQSKNPLSFLLLNSLWENNFDPINPVSEGQELLVNDIDIAVKNIQSDKINVIDFECDNAASEIAADLILIHYLLKNKVVKKVNLRVKNYPILISDAILTDVNKTIEAFSTSPDERARNIGNELKQFLELGTLNPVVSKTSTTGTALKYHVSEYQESDLIILKGDVNYRRITENRYWGFDTNINDIIPDNLKPVLIIRTIKNQVAIAAIKKLVEKLLKIDSEWCRKGLGGSVQRVGAQKKDKELVTKIEPISSFSKTSLIQQAI